MEAKTSSVKEEKKKEEEEEEVVSSGGDVSLPPIAEVEMRHATALLQKAGEMPLDVARTILATHFRTLRAMHAAGLQRLTGGFIQCPSCSTPWIAALCKPRLLGCPRNPRALRGKLRGIIRRARTRPRKLTAKEKLLLMQYRERKNVIGVLCLVCRHKKEELFDIPGRKEEEEEEEEEVETEGSSSKRKKRKRKRVKEVNAGLLLSSSSSSMTTERRKKRKKNLEEDASTTSSVFTTSTEGEAAGLDAPGNFLETRKGSPSQSHFKPRPKVLLGTNAATLPQPPAPAILREKQKTVANLRRAMGRESAKSDGGKRKNSLSSFLDSLL